MRSLVEPAWSNGVLEEWSRIARIFVHSFDTPSLHHSITSTCHARLSVLDLFDNDARLRCSRDPESQPDCERT